MMCMLTGLNKKAPIKASSPIINSLNAGLNSGLDDLLLDSGTTDLILCVTQTCLWLEPIKKKAAI